MKRWLIASLGLNLVLIGSIVGFAVTAALPPLPFFPPMKRMQSFERDIHRIVEVLEPEAKQKALAIIDRRLAEFHEKRGQFLDIPPGPDGLFEKFENRTVNPELPDFILKLNERRGEEMRLIHQVVFDLSQVLDEGQRKKVAAAMRQRLREVDRCVGAPPPQ